MASVALSAERERRTENVFHMLLRHKKTCRNKLTLSSGTLMFRLKEKFSVFRNFFDQ